MVEFVLVVPVLCVVLFGVMQFGAIYNHYLTMTDAARVGARKAAVTSAPPRPRRLPQTPQCGARPPDLDPAKLTSPWTSPPGCTARRHRHRHLPLRGQPAGLCRGVGKRQTSKTTERVE